VTYREGILKIIEDLRLDELIDKDLLAYVITDYVKHSFNTQDYKLALEMTYKEWGI
jgi:hypothetical protein